MSYRPAGQSPSLGEAPAPHTIQAPEAFSLVDRYSAIEGTFSTRRDLRIEGEMRGTLRCQGLLYVAEGADVDATVEAANIAVAGQLRGQITCHGKLHIMPTGRVLATVSTDSLVINEGAIYEGELHMAGETATVATPVSAGEVTESPSSLRRFGGEEGSDRGLPAPRGRRG